MRSDPPTIVGTSTTLTPSVATTMHRLGLLFGALLLLATPALGQSTPSSVENATTHFRNLAKAVTAQGHQPSLRGSIEVLEAANRYMADDEEWIITGNTSHTYDSTYRLVTTVSGAEPGDPLEPQHQTVRLYDAQHRVSETHFSHWDAFNEEFVLTHRAVFTYSGSSTQAASVVSQFRMGDTWVNQYRETFTLSGDGSGFTAGQVDQWDGEGWVPATLFTLSVLEAGVIYAMQQWDGTDWVNDERITVFGFTFADFMSLLAEISVLEEDYQELLFITSVLPDALYELWAGAAWVPYQRQSTTSFYDGGSGALLRAEKLIEILNEDEWEQEGRIVLTYDLNEDELLDELEIQSYEEEEWQSMFWESYVYTDTERFSAVEQFIKIEIEWEPGQVEVIVIPMGLYTFEWAPAIVGVEQPASPVSASLDAVYPNPARDGALVTYRLDATAEVALDVFDLLGRRISSLVQEVQPEGVHTVRLDTSSMPAGLYVLRLQTLESRDTRTFTVVR